VPESGRRSQNAQRQSNKKRPRTGRGRSSPLTTGWRRRPVASRLGATGQPPSRSARGRTSIVRHTNQSFDGAPFARRHSDDLIGPSPGEIGGRMGSAAEPRAPASSPIFLRGYGLSRASSLRQAAPDSGSQRTEPAKRSTHNDAPRFRRLGSSSTGPRHSAEAIDPRVRMKPVGPRRNSTIGWRWSRWRVTWRRMSQTCPWAPRAAPITPRRRPDPGNQR